MIKPSERRTNRIALVVAVIALVASIVSAGVSAWASVHTANKSIESQKQQALDSYLRDSRKVAYFDLLQKLKAMDGSYDQLERDVHLIVLGESCELPKAHVDDFKHKLDEFAYTSEPVVIIGDEDTTVPQLEKLTVNASGVLSSALTVNANAQCNVPKSNEVQDLVQKFEDALVHGPTAGLEVQLLNYMRRDLGVPNRPAPHN